MPLMVYWATNILLVNIRHNGKCFRSILLLFDPNGKLIAINPTEQEIKQQLNHNKK